MKIELLKLMLEYYNDIKRFKNDINENFDYNNNPKEYDNFISAAKDFVECKELDTESTIIVDLIKKYDFLFKEIYNRAGAIQFRYWLMAINYQTAKAFIGQIDENLDEIQEVYDNLSVLQELGIDEIWLENFAEVKGSFGLSATCNGKSAIMADYMDSLQFCIGYQDYAYKPTKDTNYDIYIYRDDSDGKRKIKYGHRIFINDLIKFKASDLPKTVKEFNDYYELIKKSYNLYIEKEELKGIKAEFNNYQKSFGGIYRVIQNRKIYNAWNLKEENKAAKKSFNKYIAAEEKRINEEHNMNQTDKIRIRI